MDLNWVWLLLGAAALLLALINLSRAALKEHRGWQWLLFASLSCGALTLLFALRAVNYWLRKGDWAAIEDVVPALAMLCSAAAGLGIILNLLALWLHLRAENTRKVEETDGKS